MDSRALARTQGAYYAATGIWSLVDVDSFQRVTGPKTDVWLVKTVGALVTVMGGALMQAAREADGPSRAMRTLAIGSAGGLAAVEAYYALKRRISPVYLLDAAAEVGLVGAWLTAGRDATGARGA